MAEQTQDSPDYWVGHDERSDTLQDAYQTSESSALAGASRGLRSTQIYPSSDFSSREDDRDDTSCLSRITPSSTTAENNPSITLCETGRQYEKPSLELFLVQNTLKRGEDRILHPNRFDPQSLNKADIRPPITQESLSELDIERIIHNPRMRYDLNFDKEARFRPGYDNPDGKVKRGKSQAYWMALSIELAPYMECALKPGSKILRGMHPYRQLKTRLPSLFATLYCILKTLTRDEDWSAIDKMIDVDLIMQQLRKGICDLVGLNDRLGSILKGSCSPLRDDAVDAVVGMMNKAAREYQPVDLSEGLKQLFSLLEILKLDIANHQIRTLRFLMINDSTQYVREHYSERIRGNSDSGPALSQQELSRARAWYKESTRRVWREQNFGEGEELDSVAEEVRIGLFGGAVRDLIRPTGLSEIPIPFEYDYNRLRDLRVEYDLLLFDRQILHAFRHTLRALGFQQDLTPDKYGVLLSRISDLTGSTQLSEENAQEAIICEMAWAACAFCGLTGYPSEENVVVLRDCLRTARDPSTEWFERIEKDLCHDLDDYMDLEIQAIYNLPELEIVMNRYQPDYPPPPAPAPSLEARRLKSLGERIAQITVLNWRIWAPILFHPLPEHPAETNTSDLPGSPPDSNASYMAPAYQSPGSNVEEYQITLRFTPAHDGRTVNNTRTQD